MMFQLTLALVLLITATSGQLQNTSAGCSDVRLQIARRHEGQKAEVMTTSGLTECRERCLSYPKCQGATFYKTTKGCELFTYIGRTEVDRDASSMTCFRELKQHYDDDNEIETGTIVSADAQSACEKIIESEETSLEGEVLKTNFASTLKECQEQCFKNSYCVGASYQSIKKTCFQFSFIGGQRRDKESTSSICADESDIHDREKRQVGGSGDTTTDAATTTVATTTAAQTNLDTFEREQGKSIIGVIIASRRKRALTGATLTACADEAVRLNAVAFVAKSAANNNYDCSFYSAVSYLIDEVGSIAFYSKNATAAVFNAVIDQCLTEANLTRDTVNGIPNMGWRDRWFTCRSYPTAMNCMMREFDKCLDIQAFAGDAWDFIDKFYKDCYVWRHPGLCPETAATCSGSTANVTSCRFTSYEGSWTDGSVTYSYNYEWGYDRDCPQLHRCCNGGNGIGTCVRAVAPETGCDIHEASQCRPKIFRNAVFVNRKQFCTDYLDKFEECFTRHIATCDNETLAQFDNWWGFRWELRALINTKAVCNYDPCTPDPCSGNGKCINLYDAQLSRGDEELTLWEAAEREWRAKQAWRCECNKYFRGLQCEIPECPMYEISLGSTQLAFLGGAYNLGVMPGGFGMGYISRSSIFFIVPQPGGGLSFYSVTTVTVILTFNAQFLVTFVQGGFGIDSFFNAVLNFQRSCVDGQGYPFEYGWHLEDQSFAPAFGLVPQQMYSLSTSIPIGCETYKKICVSIDGYATFTNDACPTYNLAQNFIFPPFNTISAPKMPQFSVFQGQQGIHTFAGGLVYFGEHYAATSTNIIRATRDIQNLGHADFKARVVLVVTWHKMSTLLSLFGIPATNTYQLVMASDFESTFVMYYHDEMLAASQISFSSILGVQLQMGALYYRGSGASILYDANTASPFSSTSGDKGLFIATQGNKLHTTSNKRFWFWDVTDKSCQVTLSACQKWILNNSTESFELDLCKADTCPPSELFAISMGFRCLNGKKYQSNTRTCYQNWIWISNGGSWRSGNRRYARTICCFTKSALACARDSSDLLNALDNPEQAGSLITSKDLAGYTTFLSRQRVTVTYSYSYKSGSRSYSYSGSYTSNRWTSNDIEGWNICCDDASAQAGDCELFYNFRRIATTRCFIPRFISMIRGDPHFTTVDNTTYTFNGHGEYILVKTRDGSTEIQVRTARVVKDDGNQTLLGNATKFSGIAISQNGSQTIQVQLDDPYNTNATLQLFADGIPIIPQGSDEDPTFGSTTVKIVSNTSARVSMDGDWSVNIQVARGLMLFGVTVPENQAGNIVGLLGTYNNDSSDDFERPDGTNLDTNETMENIHWKFGQKWSTTNLTSKFTYLGDENWDTFSHPEFVPTFFDPQNVNEETKKLCGGDEQCMFDFQSTGDRAIAMDTAAINKNAEMVAATLANSAPTLKVQNGTSVTLEAGKSAAIIVDTADADGDTVTLEKATGYRTDCLSISGTIISIIPNTVLRNCDIAVLGRDSKGITSVVTQLTIVECPSCVNGLCEHASAERHEGATNNYYKNASCACNLGWSGPTCEEAINPCNPNPCASRTCSPVVASQSNSRGYECACLPGEVRVGGSCFIPLPSSNDTVVLPDDELSREMIVVITVCAIIVVMGFGLVVLYVFSLKLRTNRIGRQRMSDMSSTSNSGQFAARMNMQGWWRGNHGYGWNPANPNPHRGPRSYQHRPLDPRQQWAPNPQSNGYPQRPMYSPTPFIQGQGGKGPNLGRAWSWSRK